MSPIRRTSRCLATRSTVYNYGMTRIEQLSRLGNAAAARVFDAFNADQPRDASGKWDSGSAEAASNKALEASGAANKSTNYTETSKTQEQADLHAKAAKLNREAAAAKAAVYGPNNRIVKDHLMRASQHEANAVVMSHVERMQSYKAQMNEAVKNDKTGMMAAARAATPASAMAGKPFTSTRERRDMREARLKLR